MAAEKVLTVKGLQKEQKELTDSFGKTSKAFLKAQASYKAAKDKLVEFNNGYGRVLEVLDAAE